MRDKISFYPKSLRNEKLWSFFHIFLDKKRSIASYLEEYLLKILFLWVCLDLQTLLNQVLQIKLY